MTRRRQLRYLALLLLAAVVLGLLYGVLLGTVGLPDLLLTWWGTCLRALLAVTICSALAQAVDRRLERRATRHPAADKHSDEPSCTYPAVPDTSGSPLERPANQPG
jgi:hypothetical protein